MKTPLFSQVVFLIVVCGLWTVSERAQASFHFMQIEQVIGGVNGDTTAQAIQLRMRSSFQHLVGNQSEINVYDATGANPVLLVDFATNVTNFAAGSRILVTTPNFANHTNIPLVSDFTMNPIPVSYLAAGQISFEADSALFGKLWNLNYGGASYTGTTTGGVTNDANGDFGPPFGGPLPTSSTSALLFQGAFSALSTTNLADYALTAGASTFTNNAGTPFTVVAAAADSANFDGDSDVDGTDFLIWQRGNGSPGGLAQGDANNDGNVNAADLAIWETQYSLPVPLSGIATVPEPHSLGLLCCGLLAFYRRTRRTC